jgi:predicted transcriptional regulator
MRGNKGKEFLEHQLSRRERQIMQAVYRLGRGTIAQIADNIPEPPTHDAIRRLCHILKEKGLLRIKPAGGKNVFLPTIDAKRARRLAVENVIDTFFGGSPGMLVAQLIDSKKDDLSDQDLERINKMIDSYDDIGKGS